MSQLAAIAEEVKELPVHTQFRVLGAAGLTLTDINWENCNDDPRHLVTVIPIREGAVSMEKPDVPTRLP